MQRYESDFTFETCVSPSPHPFIRKNLIRLFTSSDGFRLVRIVCCLFVIFERGKTEKRETRTGNKTIRNENRKSFLFSCKKKKSFVLERKREKN
jgi:hypothetical protein